MTINAATLGQDVRFMAEGEKRDWGLKPRRNLRQHRLHQMPRALVLAHLGCQT